MPVPSPEVMDRKLASLRRFIADLAGYARPDAAGRRREHYAIERLPEGKVLGEAELARLERLA